MPPATRPCPKCGVPLALPQPMPEKLSCPNCQAVMKVASSRSGAVAAGPLPAGARGPAVTPVEARPAPVASAPPPKRRALGVLLLAGLVVLVAAGATTAVVLFRLDERDPEKEPQGGTPVVHPKPQPPPPDPRLKIVQPAIDRGVAFLKAQVQGKGSLTHSDDARIGGQTAAGVAALIGLTLLECGAPPDDPAVLRVAEILRADAPRLTKVYPLSAALFFLNRWNELRPLAENDRKLAQSFALRIIAGQLTSGIWGYDGALLAPDQEAKLLAELRQGTYKPARPGRHDSVSNTQFAMLALWGARKHGVPVRDALLAAAGHFHRTQARDGHWIYSEIESGPLWATSTCAGLMALAMEKALLEDKEFVTHRPAPDPNKKGADVAKAFEYVARSIGRKKGDPGGATHMYAGGIFQADAWGDLYFLWSVERLGMIYDRPSIGGKDWYEWGYPIVMKAQNADGSWDERHGRLVDSCFALLFLKRANIAKDLTDKLRDLLARAPGGAAAPLPPRGPREA
jgi:hypothetical protein